MTISNSENRYVYSGNGITTAFSFPRYFAASADLAVYVTVVATGVATLQTLGVHYTVTGADDPAGGTVTFVTAPASGRRVTIIRNEPLRQNTDVTTINSMRANAYETALDAIVRQIYRAWDLVGRSLKLRTTDVDGSGAYDGGGNRITNLADPTDDTDAATKGWIDGYIAPSITDATDAADAAAASAAAAAASAAAADADATSAASDAAATSADAVATAADRAAVAADKATVAADKATVAADKATVAADKATTSGYKDSASASASAASTSASGAATSASAAAASATAADASADAAAVSEANAAASAAEAAGYAGSMTPVEDQITAATTLATPDDADEFGYNDVSASALKKFTWGNLKSAIWTAWGALINAGTSKNTPVDADALALMDSADANATKKLTWQNLKATLKTYNDTLYQATSAVLTTLASKFVAATTTVGAYLDFNEGSNNGTNYARVTAPAALGGNRTITLPDATGTVALLDAAAQQVSGGARVTVYDNGTKSSGTFTPDPGNGQMQKSGNNGAHTLAPGSNYGNYILTITNGASAGAITTSGWTKKSGDAFTTTNGHKFRLYCVVDADGSTMEVRAMQ